MPTEQGGKHWQYGVPLTRRIRAYGIHFRNEHRCARGARPRPWTKEAAADSRGSVYVPSVLSGQRKCDACAIGDPERDGISTGKYYHTRRKYNTLL
jgi:hypothetical protein